MNPRILSDGAVLRQARHGDEHAILRCIRSLAEYEREPDAVVNTAERLGEILFGDAPGAYAHVVERDGEVIAIAIWFLTYSTWTGKQGMWLEDLWVDEQERGRGYGRALVTTLAAVCIEHGYPRFEWTVLDWNAPSIAFYRALGAEPMSEWTTQRVTGAALGALAATGDHHGLGA